MNALSSPSASIEALLGRDEAGLGDIFRARAGATPDATFVWTEQGSYSYRQTQDQVSRFAGLLAARGIGAGLRVAAYLDNRPETLWAWLGAAWGGAVHVALNRAHRGPFLADLVARSRAQLLVTDVDGAAVLHSAGVTDVPLLVVDGGDEWMLTWDHVDASEPAAAVPVDPMDVAMVLFTSGTTGRSKAVRISHNQCVRGGAAVAWSAALTPGDVFHCWWPLYHVAAMVDTTIPSMIAGGSIALYAGFSRTRFWCQVQRSGATVFGGMAHVLELLSSLPEQPADARSTLRAGVIGYIPPGVRAPFERRFGVHLLDTYGMTEVEPIALPHPGQPTPEGSCGRPNPDLEVAILTHDDHPAPVGVLGEITVRPRRPGVLFDGYEDDAAATVEAWRNLWFHTGDLGWMDDGGHLYFSDRSRDVIRRRGENISTWELEQLVAAHPDIVECAAVGVPSPLGEDDVKLVVVPRCDDALTPGALQQWCAMHLAEFMRPRFVELCDGLPRNATGKVEKSALRSHGQHTFDAEHHHRQSRPAAGDDQAGGSM